MHAHAALRAGAPCHARTSDFNEAFTIVRYIFFGVSDDKTINWVSWQNKENASHAFIRTWRSACIQTYQLRA